MEDQVGPTQTSFNCHHTAPEQLGLRRHASTAKRTEMAWRSWEKKHSCSKEEGVGKCLVTWAWMRRLPGGLRCRMFMREICVCWSGARAWSAVREGYD